MYKALNGITNIVISPYVDFYTDADCYPFTHYDILSLKKMYARTNLLKHNNQQLAGNNYYFQRAVDSWNTLPMDTHNAADVMLFKTGVRRLLREH